MNVVITGGSKGIGKALVEKFYVENHHIIICSRSENNLLDLKNLLEKNKTNGSITTFSCDVTDINSINEFIKFIDSHFNTIDILINNAGIFIPGQIHNEEDGSLDKMMQTNLYSAYHITRKIVPNMIKNKSGYIFNMCSIASIKAYNNGGSYAISKFALLGFSKSLREELKEYSIKVSAVLPGATFTDSWSGTDLPEDRFIQAKDIANLIYTISQLSNSTVVEDITIRPQLGDI